MIYVYESTCFPWFAEDPGGAWIWQEFGRPSLKDILHFLNSNNKQFDI